MQKSSLARASIVIFGLTIAANISGFIARAIIGATFGNSVEHSAFRAAFGVPDLLFNLLAGGALGSAFIPVFAARLKGAQWTHAWQLARRIALTAFGVMAVFAALAAWRAPWLVETFTSTNASPAVRQLIVPLMRIMLISTVIFSISGLLMGILQSGGIFVAPALAAVLYNVGMALGAYFLSGRYGIYGAAIGVVLGALLHLGVQLPALRRLFVETRPSAEMATPELDHDVSSVINAMPLRMIGSGSVYFNNIVRDLIALGWPTGVAALSNAFATMILPQAAIAQAISTALFPTISLHAARGERDEFSRAVSRAINVIIGLSAPAAAGLIALGPALIGLLFERGKWTTQDSRQVSLALAMYALGLVAHCVLEIVTRAFYALKDNRQPVIWGVLSMLVNVGLSFALLPLFERITDFPFIALALANSVATTLETIALCLLLANRYPEIGLGRSARELGKALLGAAVMAAAVWGWRWWMGDSALAALGGVLIGALVYGICAIALRLELWTFARSRRNPEEIRNSQQD
jgi:putative peptidoglycan lipid II flippase